MPRSIDDSRKAGGVRQAARANSLPTRMLTASKNGPGAAGRWPGHQRSHRRCCQGAGRRPRWWSSVPRASASLLVSRTPEPVPPCGYARSPAQTGNESSSGPGPAHQGSHPLPDHPLCAPCSYLNLCSSWRHPVSALRRHQDRHTPTVRAMLSTVRARALAKLERDEEAYGAVRLGRRRVCQTASRQ
jgi:hypothetical protein